MEERNDEAGFVDKAVAQGSGKGMPMFRKGQVLYDEKIGARYTFLRTAEDTDGEMVRIESVLRPGPGLGVASAHPNQAERFEVVSGTMALTVDGREHLLGPGEAFVVPPGARHAPKNASDGELRLVGEVRPAGRFEEFLAEVTAANNSGREGLAWLLTAARVLRRFPDVERPTSLPRPAERALFAVLAAAGWLLGLGPDVGGAATGTASRSRDAKGPGTREENGTAGGGNENEMGCHE